MRRASRAGDRLCRTLDGISGTHDRVTQRAVATGRALLPAEPLSEAAYQAGLEAMFAAVDESFPSTADADEADARAAEHDNWALLPDVRSAKTPDGVLVVAASVNTLDDAAVARITQQAAQVVEKQRGRTGANDR